MKTKLTLASKKDKKPTISANVLGCNNPEIEIEMEIRFTLNSNLVKVKVPFHISRDTKSYYADNWNPTWPLPSVGKPLIVNIVSIQKVKKIYIERKLF
jgi:hypothetical protein